ncbi:hypothetical protein D3C73_1147020 [compost metagenome]
MFLVVLPAGARATFSTANLTTTVCGTVAPSLGDTIDTSAPFGAGVALASTETPINRPAKAARDIKVFILFSSFFVKSAWP